jgi:hypothetical protein
MPPSIDVLVADVVAHHGEQAHLVAVCCWPGETNIRPSRADQRLNGVAGQGPLADASPPLANIDPHVGRFPGFWIVVVFDVVARDLEIAHLAIEHLDPPALAETDVTALDDGLVQVHLIKEDANPPALVDMTGGDEQIASAVREPDATHHLADQHARECWLKGVLKLQPV